MADDRRLTGRRALVTGASSGIGADLARALARRGAALVLTARRGDRLDALAAELRRDHAVATTTVALDLAAPGAVDTLWARATADGAIDVLINNAGFGHFRRFVDVEPDRDAELLALNVGAVVALCHHFAGAHRDRPAGAPTVYLMNVASVAAWQALPHFATYAASKVFVRSLSEALHVELRAHRIVVTCLCPGGTRSEFHALAGAGNYGRLANASMLDAAVVAERGVRAMLRGERTVVTGTLNRISTLLAGLAPRSVATWMGGRVLGRPRPEALPARAAPPPPASLPSTAPPTPCPPETTP